MQQKSSSSESNSLCKSLVLKGKCNYSENRSKEAYFRQLCKQAKYPNGGHWYGNLLEFNAILAAITFCEAELDVTVARSFYLNCEFCTSLRLNLYEILKLLCSKN